MGDDRPVSAVRTRFCRQLGIDYPIWSVGFGGAGPELVAAASGAGGFGVLGASGLPADAITAPVARTRELTDRPFGINLVIGAASVDAVIAQGIEAGGHVRGTTSIWGLLPATVAALGELPVLASGGVGDGAGVARALGLGAQGVSLGTRFVASDEAFIHPAYKQRIVRASAEDTVYHQLYDLWRPDAPHRTLRNRTLREWEAAGRPPPGQRPGEGVPIGTFRDPSGELVPWPRYALGVATADFDGTSSTHRCGPASPAAW